MPAMTAEEEQPEMPVKTSREKYMLEGSLLVYYKTKYSVII